MDMLEPSQLFSNSCSKHEVGELHEFPKDLNNELDIELMQQHYIKMLATDFVRGKRASKDRELRSKSRKLFEILSGLLHRIQVDHSISLSDDGSNDDRPSDSNRCRDSDLRTLRKANQTLLALLDVSRELKKKKMELKSKKRRQHSKIKKSKISNREVVSKDVSQVTQYLLNQYIPPQPQTYHQTYAMPNGMIYQQPVMYNTSAEPFYYPTYP
jgi:multidrug efflux pump subunit AcrB